MGLNRQNISMGLLKSGARVQWAGPYYTACSLNPTIWPEVLSLVCKGEGICSCICVLVLTGEITPLFCTFFFMSCCWMPDAKSPHTLAVYTGACKCVYYLPSLDSKAQEMFSLLLSPIHTYTFSVHLSFPSSLCFPPSYFFLPSPVAYHILCGYQKKLTEFTRVYFILFVIYFLDHCVITYV